jgi:hypothetical protein
MRGEFLGLGTATLAVYEAGEITSYGNSARGEPCSPGQAKSMSYQDGMLQHRTEMAKGERRAKKSPPHQDALIQ